ncbi:MAG TPA: hypothetical protein VGO40_15575 [Longimicrobium sp.]|jgi:hypothetical protein|nr:hypothetical protein [Longimicrobium sp.]
MPPRLPQNAILRDQILREAVEMIRYAFASGKSVPTGVVDTVEQYESHPRDAPPLAPSPLVLAHSRLVKIVAPATPRAIEILADGNGASRFAFLGPVALVRQLMLVAIGCMLAFVLIGLFEATGTTTVTFVNAWGWTLLLNQAWWLAAAGVGASFAILFQVNEYIGKSNYNPRYAPTYWVKFLLGLMAGYILVALLPFDLQRQGTGVQLMQPAIAMLGGYSASAVYRILTRLVEAVETIFRGNAREVIAEREQAAAARASEEASRGRVRLAARLVDVQRQLAAGAANDEVSATIRDIMASLIPELAEAEQPPAAAPQAPTPAAITVAATPQALVAAAGRAPRKPARDEAAAG